MRERSGSLFAPTIPLVTLILLASCGDLPTGSVPSTARTQHGVAGDRDPGTVPAVCTVSERSATGPYAYQYSKLTLNLPRAAAASDSRTSVFRYRGHGSGGEIVLAANCVIPSTEKAAEAVHRMFRSVGSPVRDAWEDDSHLAGGDLGLGGLTVNACQYGGEWPNCEEQKLPKITVKETAFCYDGVCDSGVQPLGGGSSATPPDPDPEPEPEPCNTGDPVLDSPAVLEGMDSLMKASNPDAVLFSRAETGGWVVRTSTGFRIDQWPVTASFCGGDFTVAHPAEGPGAIVGFIHTHPYSVGENVIACGSDGQTSIQTYQGLPSDVDRNTSVSLGTALGRAGPLPGIIIDKSGIREYAGWDLAKDEPHARCGY